MKKFNIIGSVYRGSVVKDSAMLHSYFTIIAGIVVLEAKAVPLRSVQPLSIPEEDEMEAEATRERWASVKFFRGDGRFPLGDPERDLQEDEAGDSVGVGDRPRMIHRSENAFAELATGQQVLVWYWGWYWPGVIVHCAPTLQTFTIRWDWSHGRSPGFRSEEIWRLDQIDGYEHE